MIFINKEEAAAVRKKFPKAHIVRTMKNKSKRGHYYCEESREVARYVDVLRGNAAADTFVDKGRQNKYNNKREGAGHRNYKKK